jgi:cysteinyl-tRNA synthetase
MSRSDAASNKLRLFNTRTRAVQPFVPLRDGLVRVYVCGLTPSAEAHLGHARSFLFFDVLRRYLVYLGYRVDFVRNVTDIDDRSIEAARQSGGDWREIVGGYYTSFQRSMRRLHVIDPDHEPRATAYVPQILAMIEELIAGGHAYVAGDGVYFRVRSFARYGALSGRNLDELMVGARIAPGEDKADPLDFALWKFVKPGEPSWPSPWGDGRPGWHIECSAMARELLGEPFDIHGGGYDLVFPHHENEIAQSESLMPAPPMANVWMHGGLLQFDGRKMSKSLGNFEPLYALLDRHDPQAIRLLFLQTGYRKPMNFTEDSIDGATTALRRLLGAYDALRAAPPGPAEPAADGDPQAVLEEFEPRFFAALDDDVNTSGAMSVLFELAAAQNRIVAAGAASSAAAFMHQAMELLGISPAARSAPSEAPATTSSSFQVGGADYGVEAPQDVEAVLSDAAFERLRAALDGDPPLDGKPKAQAVERVIVARAQAKSAKDFARADRLRDALKAAGIAVTDLKNGASWTVAG